MKGNNFCIRLKFVKLWICIEKNVIFFRMCIVKKKWRLKWMEIFYNKIRVKIGINLIEVGICIF